MPQVRAPLSAASLREQPALAQRPPAPAAQSTGYPSTSGYDALPAVVRTHQIDDLFLTHWDTERCQAASAIAIAALADKSYLNALGMYVMHNLEGRIDALWRLVGDLSSQDPALREQARRALIPEIQRHIDAFDLSPAAALAELGYSPSDKPGIGIGIPPHIADAPVLISDGVKSVALASPDPVSSAVVISSAEEDTHQRKWFVRDGVRPDAAKNVSVPAQRAPIPWYRVIGDDVNAKVELQSKDLELAPAGQVMALYQLTGDELKLVDRVIGCLEAELEKARATAGALRSANPKSEVLQELADSLLVAQQHTSVGLNAYETTEALRACGLVTQALTTPVPWSNLLAATAPGDCLLLEGKSHAMTFGRLRDGRAFIYDSEGVLGDRNEPCLRFVKPGEDPAIDEHYGTFRATHLCRPQAARDVLLGKDVPRLSADQKHPAASPGVSAVMSSAVLATPSGPKLRTIGSVAGL